MIIRKIGPYLIQVLAVVLVLPAAADTIYNASLASPTANPATPACYAGSSGCINGGFTVSSDGTTELGLRAVLRGKGLAPEVGNKYTVPLGTSGIYALWNYTFSIDTRPNGVGTATLSSYTYSLSMTDLTTGATRSYNPLNISDDAVYGPTGVTTRVTSPTKQWGAQNAENFNFAGLGTPGFNPNSTDGYQITLSEYSGSSLVNSDTILVNDTAPEPSTFFLFGTGLIAVAFIVRKRVICTI
jgi:hypothetical protein